MENTGLDNKESTELIKDGIRHLKMNDTSMNLLDYFDPFFDDSQLQDYITTLIHGKINYSCLISQISIQIKQ